MSKTISTKMKAESSGLNASLISTIKHEFQITCESGLTMLRCSQLIEELNDFTGTVKISNGAISVNGRSMIDLLQLAAVAGTVISIELTGRGADLVMARISPLLTN